MTKKSYTLTSFRHN